MVGKKPQGEKHENNLIEKVPPQIQVENQESTDKFVGYQIPDIADPLNKIKNLLEDVENLENQPSEVVLNEDGSIAFTPE